MNRIKELRLEKGLTLKELAQAFNEFTAIKRDQVKSVSYATISRWEKGINEPKLEVWQELADYFQVPIPYLMGTSEYKGSMDEWAKVTGYSAEKIQKEIDRLEQAHRLTDENRQEKIAQAVMNLDGRGNDEYSVIVNLAHNIRGMVYDYLDPYFYDLKAMEKERKEKGLDPHMIQPPIFYDDMRHATYMKVDEIISSTARELAELADKIKKEKQ